MLLLLLLLRGLVRGSGWGLLTTDQWPYFLLITDFWPKILATADFCDVEFNDLAKKKFQNIQIFVKLALWITD